VRVGKRVMLAHQFDQPVFKDMCIDLRRRYVRVAEKLLDGAQIRAVLQEVAGEGVAKDVRRHLGRRNACPGGKPFNSRAKT
jgi:hypothetical protein